jgi:hypothetical protein
LRPRFERRTAANLLAVLLALVALGPWIGPSAAVAAQRPIPAVEDVVIISVDGLRPDVMLRANAPAMRSLMRDGAFTFWARTTEASITLPSHTSMLTGVTPAKHQILWNSDLPQHMGSYPAYPTIFELAGRAGLGTEMAAGKSKFRTLNKPQTIDRVFVPQGIDASVDDTVVADHALELFAQGPARPALLFVHFPDVDAAGHAHGWGSPEQIGAVEKADTQIARILAAIDRAKTIIILSADHGGAGPTHGPDDPRSRHIPWIIAGPGVKRGFDLTRIAQLQVNTEDTAATAAWLLGLPIPAYFDGKAVIEASEGR